MKERWKENKLAQYLIRNGWGFHGIKGRRIEKRKIKEQERKYQLNDKENIFEGIEGIKIYLPEYKTDVVQKSIVIDANYYEYIGLERAKKYIVKKGSGNALDIGANIGSHTLYFIKEYGMEKVWSFEPVPSTFAILKKNIELNSLEQKVCLENVGIGEREYHASVKDEFKHNRGGTSIKEDDTGIFQVKTIDSYDILNVSLIKIDTEGYEIKVLQGAEETIVKCRPIILIEIAEANKDAAEHMMKKWKYKKVSESSENYIFIPEEL